MPKSKLAPVRKSKPATKPSAKAPAKSGAIKSARATKTAAGIDLASRYPALPTAAHTPLADLIDVGSRFSVASLSNHATDVLAKLSAYPAFAELGFTSSWVSAVEQLGADIAAASQSKAVKGEDRLATGEALDAIVATAKAWRRRAMTSVDLTPSLRGTLHHVPSGSSVPQLAQALRTVLPVVGKPAATAFGGGASAKASGAGLLARLDAASKAHRTTIAALSPEGRALNSLKGLLYEELRRLGRAAREIAPGESALFAVSRHVRSHHGKKKAPAAKPPVSATPTA